MGCNGKMESQTDVPGHSVGLIYMDKVNRVVSLKRWNLDKGGHIFCELLVRILHLLKSNEKHVRVTYM